MTHITTEGDEYPLVRLATNSGVLDVNVVGGECLHMLGSYLVFLNGKFAGYFFLYFVLRIFLGNILGVIKNAKRLLDSFRLWRRSGMISHYVSIYLNKRQRCIYVSSDGGRLCRPYIIVENGRPLVTAQHISDFDKGIGVLRSFEDFLQQGTKNFKKKSHLTSNKGGGGMRCE